MDIKVVLKEPRWPLAGASGGVSQEIAVTGLECERSRFKQSTLT